jgi:transcriptional regulator with XRE-family HTH domain
MDLNENIRNNIQKLRKERNITQEVLAAAMEVSVQAISKWETGASLPDIMQLPRIAKFFGVTIDYLFYNEGVEETFTNGELPNDDVLRIIQFKGNQMLGMDRWDREKSIKLILPEKMRDNCSDNEINLEIWGNADVEGDISGYVECGGYLNCGNIGGYVENGGNVNCGNIGNYVESGGNVNCGNISGYVECGSKINCGNVGGYVESGGSANCANIGGYVECAGDLSCNDIMNEVECSGNIRCKEIHGNVECEGDVIYER